MSDYQAPVPRGGTMQYPDPNIRVRATEAKTALLNLIVVLLCLGTVAFGIPLAVLTWKAAF